MFLVFACLVKWQYAEEGPKPLAKLLVDGDWYAIYHRLRNPRIPFSKEDLFKPYNGVNFLQLLPHFPEFRGGEEINYRLVFVIMGEEINYRLVFVIMYYGHEFLVAYKEIFCVKSEDVDCLS